MSKGLDIISNDSLRGNISKLYELHYPYYAKYENERVLKVNHIILPKYTRYFSFYWSDDSPIYFNGSSEITQESYMELKNDISFINTLNLAIQENDQVQNRAKRTAGYIKALSDQIDEELR